MLPNYIHHSAFGVSGAAAGAAAGVAITMYSPSVIDIGVGKAAAAKATLSVYADQLSHLCCEIVSSLV